MGGGGGAAGAADDDDAAPVGFMGRMPGHGGKYVESNPGRRGAEGAEGCCSLMYGSCSRIVAAAVLRFVRAPGRVIPFSVASVAAISQSASSRSRPGLLMSRFAESMSFRALTPSILMVFEPMTSMSYPGYFFWYMR